MARADNHEHAARAAREAADKLLGVARGKAAKAVDPQTDRFAKTAAEAARTQPRE